MTEPFESRYRILDQVTQGSVRTFNALASTGAVVMVHFLDDDAARELLPLLDHLRPDDRARVLEVAEVDGTRALVTRFILGFESLATWLHELTGGIAPAGAPPAHRADVPAASTPPPAPPGEFTMMFRAAAAGETGSPAEPSPAPGGDVGADLGAAGGPGVPGGTGAMATGATDAFFADPSAPPSADSLGARTLEGAGEPGEFTRMFRSPASEGRSRTPGESAAADLPAADSAESGHGGGWVDVKPESRPAVPPEASRTGPDEAGEFTRIFKGLSPDAAVSEGSPTGAVEPPATSAQPGEFTQLFRAVDPGTPAPPGATPPPPAPTPGGTFSAIASAAPPPPPPASGPPPPQPPPVPAAGPAQEPGEFTRIFQGLNPGAPAAPHAPPSAAPPPPPPPIAPTPGAPVAPAAPPPPPSAVGSPPPQPPPVPTAGSSQEPGEFTRIFQGLAGGDPPEPLPSAAPPPTPAGPGEFTRMFERPDLPLGQTGASWPGQTPQPLGPPGPGAASSLDSDSYLAKLEGRPPAAHGSTPAAVPTPPPAWPQDPVAGSPGLGGIGAPPPSPAGPPPVPGVTPPPVSAPAGGAGPSEYTRVIQGLGPAAGAGAPPGAGYFQPAGVPGLTSYPPAPAPPPASSAPAGATANASSRSSAVPIILGLALVLVLAVGLVLYFVLRG